MKKIESIMLIDDNKIDLFINRKIIEKYNSDLPVNIFPNANLALNHLKRFEINNSDPSIKKPDVIFLDINMPEMDGFQFLDEFDKLTFIEKKPIEIYMLSSSASHNDIEKAKNNTKCKDYIVKPLTLKKLNTII
ncbi:response regulator [uncultured Winogradskyella sp.]|uniref:response regulator n=1 Tax=uncultured Winogradskyella sp. TaxID=395353 RepID=UPI0030DB36B2|tara:strand:- start:2014 stop:2415 length:402 start_codon:yes stop_codon:yes gene_type:complete